MADPKTGSLEGAFVAQSATIRDALQALDLGAGGIALAIDADGRLVGVSTDGDLRRALLAGATLDSPLDPVLRRDFVALPAQQSRVDALDLMRARRIDAIPVLDASGRPIALHLLHAFLEPASRENWAVVMAGGQGTRLRPLTDAVPKPMLRVAGRPILERIVLHLVGSGITRIFLSVNYLAEVIEDHFGDGSALGAAIDYLREDEPLGTAGALGLLPSLPERPLVLLNGDLVTSVDLGALLDVHAAGGFAATIGTRRYLHTVPFGCVARDGDRVVGIEEKPTITREVNTGIYALAPSVVGLVARGTRTSMPELIERVLASGQTVGAFEVEDDWVDVGQREQLTRAREGG
jgi:dTDP-glucose pyrophosphorylase